MIQISYLVSLQKIIKITRNAPLIETGKPRKGSQLNLIIAASTAVQGGFHADQKVEKSILDPCDLPRLPTPGFTDAGKQNRRCRSNSFSPQCSSHSVLTDYL
jgi:hypothetical protein